MLHVIRLFWLVLAGLQMPVSAAEPNKYEDTVKALSKPQLSNSLEGRLTEIETTINSEEYKQELEKFRGLIATNMGVDYEKNEVSTSATRPLLFISSTIPMFALRGYAKQLHDIGGGTMVLNGFIGGAKKMLPTLKFISDVVNIDKMCNKPDCKKYDIDVIIDPIMFRFHQVNRVPGLTLYEKKAYRARCDGSESFEDVSIAFGDASIKGLLIELSRIDKRVVVKNFLDKYGD